MVFSGFLTILTSSAGDVLMSKYGDQHLSLLKIGSKTLEQRFSPPPVDVGLLQQVHDESMCKKKNIAKSADMASHVINDRAFRACVLPVYPGYTKTLFPFLGWGLGTILT